MKELQENFIGRGEVKGFIFTQLNKSEKGFIYKVDTGSSVHFEVFKFRYNKQFDCISYPGSNSFGVWAWSCCDIERAKEIFNQINLNERVK
jgi:hypothetical protein